MNIIKSIRIILTLLLIVFGFFTIKYGKYEDMTLLILLLTIIINYNDKNEIKC